MMPEKYIKIKKKLLDENKKAGQVEEKFINEATDEVGGMINPQQTVVV
eukprot:CAMPEP_0205816660 /NCGR_PEP_ID=MMETSP0205-20121125/23110_1 /ASSEMBLY_ACC=CAM_ASM_000278 /TAXON_ID=36767 /ORGANISM="Euplotes focardii, Strain TN1" /LENGTH=47 /DNA_ID= /DNA_START= /DNA_END= /DNA_ORIENTATION=